MTTFMLDCGFRTGIRLLLAGHVAGGLASNPLAAPAAAGAFLTALGLLIGAKYLAAKRCP